MAVAGSGARWPHEGMNTTPRSAALLAAAVTFGLLAVGCGNQAGPPTAGTKSQRADGQERAPRQAGTPRLDQDELELALLDINDLPAGWAADTSEAAEERGIGVPEPARQPCRGLFDNRADERAESRFARTEVGPFVVARTGSHQSAEAADEALEDFRKAAKKCESFKIDEGPEGDTTKVNYTAERLRMPELGDESVALRFVREGPGDEEMTVLADVVCVRVGASSVHLAQAGVDDEDASEVEPLVRRAVDKLSEVASDGTPEPTGSFPDVTQLRVDPYARSHE